ncbi:MAG TPA: DUF799 family lipoprotein [Anaeromyxobacteraceae bacterium]|nr:DUF799 family lipoprotein [Anaeromyxobacteraceae bacterium]
MRRTGLLPAAIAVASLLGCATNGPATSYEKWVTADPRSILVVPPASKSVAIDAPAYFLSTVPIPVAERGYYVFPVHMVKRVLEDDGLSDAFLVHQADPMRLCSLFGADAVLYVTIERWDAQYVVLSSTVTVELTYVMKGGRTGDVLWKAQERMTYSSGSGGSGGLAGLIAAAIDAAVTKAAPNYMPLARQANAEALAFPGKGFPAGPYAPAYRKDLGPGK